MSPLVVRATPLVVRASPLVARARCISPLLALLLISSADAGWLTGYTVRRAFTVNDAAAPATTDLTNYPCLVNVTNASLAWVNRGGDVTQSNGYDIVFTAPNGTTRWDHELELYWTNGVVVAWVRIPVLTNGVNNRFYMYCGNAGVSTAQHNPGKTWDTNYVGVWHLDQNPDVETAIIDSSSYSNAGTAATADFEAADSVAGKVVNAIGADADGEDITCGSDAELDDIINLTIEMWVKPISLPAAIGRFTLKACAANSRTLYQSSSLLYYYQPFTSGGEKFCASAPTLVIGTWYHVGMTYNNSSPANNAVFVVDGISRTVTNPEQGTTSALADAANNLFLLNSSATGTDEAQATLDEVRISNILRSPDWIATCHTNQVAPNAFLTMGDAEWLGTLIQIK